MVLCAASLVVFGATATAIAHRFRGLVSVALALSPALVMLAAYAADATLDYARGDARLWIGGMRAGFNSPYDLIDQDTRIPPDIETEADRAGVASGPTANTAPSGRRTSVRRPYQQPYMNPHQVSVLT